MTDQENNILTITGRSGKTYRFKKYPPIACPVITGSIWMLIEKIPDSNKNTITIGHFADITGTQLSLHAKDLFNKRHIETIFLLPIKHSKKEAEKIIADIRNAHAFQNQTYADISSSDNTQYNDGLKEIPLPLARTKTYIHGQQE